MYQFFSRKRTPVLASGDDLDVVRQFPDEKNPGKGHLLVRPVGQMILAKAVGSLKREGLSLQEIFGKLKKWDENGGFAQHTTDSLWYGITYDPVPVDLDEEQHHRLKYDKERKCLVRWVKYIDLKTILVVFSFVLFFRILFQQLSM